MSNRKKSPRNATRKAWERHLGHESRRHEPTTGAKFWDVVPYQAPRQIAADAFDPRPTVLKYRAFCNEVRWRNVWAPLPGDLVVFMMPIPKSWPKYKKRDLDGMPHESVPDVDNLVKALLDASYGNDAHIWAIVPVKVWSSTPGIYIERRDPDVRIPFKLEIIGRD